PFGRYAAPRSLSVVRARALRRQRGVLVDLLVEAAQVLLDLLPALVQQAAGTRLPGTGLERIEQARLEHDEQLVLGAGRLGIPEDVPEAEEPARQVLQQGDAPPVERLRRGVEAADDGLLARQQQHLRG